MKRRWMASLGAATAVAALAAIEAGAAAQAAALPPLGTAGGAASSTRSKLIARPQPFQRRSFRIFRTPPEQLPASIATSLGDFEGHGFNPALAQRAQPPGGRPALWVIPGRGQILVAQRLAKGCAIVSGTTAGVVERGLGFRFLPSGDTAGFEGKRPPDKTRAVGLVPDGVTAVEVGRHLLAPVRNNVYSIDAGRARLYTTPVLIRPGSTRVR
jgi:hypothetical protein